MEAEVKIRDEFWSPRIEKICREIIPYQYEVLNDAVAGIPHSHAIENFRIAAGESDDQYEGMLFQDSDVAKWIEAAAWSLLSEHVLYLYGSGKAAYKFFSWT